MDQTECLRRLEQWCREAAQNAGAHQTAEWPGVLWMGGPGTGLIRRLFIITTRLVYLREVPGFDLALFRLRRIGLTVIDCRDSFRIYTPEEAFGVAKEVNNDIEALRQWAWQSQLELGEEE